MIKQKIKERGKMEENKKKKIIILPILIIVILIIAGTILFICKPDKESEIIENDEVKKALEDYLELQANLYSNNILEKLKEIGKLNYDPSKDVISDDGTITTTVKFNDYKKAMLNYVSEMEFEKSWIETYDNFSTCGISQNSNNYITREQRDGKLEVYTIKNITFDSKTNNGLEVYKADVSYVVEGDETSKPKEDSFLFQVKNKNGKYVIDNGRLFVDYVE